MFGFGLIFVLVVVPYPWGVVLVALPSAAVFVLLDRTLKMEARQAQLAEQNASLAADLSVQAQALRETGEVLRDALAAKTQMLRNVSHELRTPMVSITGYTEALMEGVFGDLNGEQQSVLGIVSRSTWHMVNLVDDLLTLQALDRKGLCLRPVRMETLFGHCRERYSEKARVAGIDLRFDIQPCTPEVWADEARLEQAVSHLIDNAIKFSPNGGAVLVTCRPVDDDHLQICVQDHGIGIPADELPKIYRSFYQVDGSATRRFSGQGLGLAITQRIAELHGGSIRAESAVGQGSTFTLELPLREDDSGPDDPANNPSLS
jgi:signal transduction histidine kinase